MAKKPKIPEHENHERWMVSYADLLTLLFALFVILYGFAMSAQTQVKSVIQGLVQSFSEMGFVTARPGSSALVGNMGIDGTSSNVNLSSTPVLEVPIVTAPVEGGGGVLDFGASNNMNESNSPEVSSGEDRKDQNAANGRDVTARSESEVVAAVNADSVTGAPLESLQQEISVSLQEMVDAKVISMTRNESWLTIDFNSALLFPSGSATILNQFKPVLDDLAEILIGVNNYVHIRGYTDDRYVGDELYHSSWELSSARAISVLNYLAAKGLIQNRMAVEAYGSFSPFASNETNRGREMNRKVVIAISKYAYSPKPLPVLAGDLEEGENGLEDVSANSPGPEFIPDEYEIIRLPDGRVRLTKKAQ